MPAPFNAAKDLVYTINGNIISSGGYRISKILNGKSKKKGNQGKQEGGNGDSQNIYSEDSGIPVGLLLLQRLHFQPDTYHDEDNRKHKRVDINADDCNATKIDSGSNKNLVYASIMGNNDDNSAENIELVVMPSSSGNENTHKNCYSENPIEICSNEIDDELYDSLIKSVSGSRPDTVIMMKDMTPLRKMNTTKKQHFGKHKDIEKVFQKRRTKSKRRSGD